MGKVYVVGVGMTKFERPGVRSDDYPILIQEVVEKALGDAKIPYTEVEQAYVSFVYASGVSGQRGLYKVGMTGIPIINVNNNCASGSSAMLLAKEDVEYDAKDCVLVVGFEKMKKGTLEIKYPNRTYPMKKQIQRLYSIIGKAKGPLAPVLFGAVGEEHMKKYGSKMEHFAKIAFKNHKHGSVNPYSQSHNAYTLEEIMNSRLIYGPLTKLQCSATTDGAAAAILASERFVIKHGLQRQAVEILGMEMATDLPSTLTEDSVMTLAGCEMTKVAAYKLFQKTKIHPTDVDIVELHDCFSTHELVLYECLGLCPPGKAAELVDRNDNTYGGKYVVNPSGGLIGKGHPIGATGVAQCVELCWHLRGEAGKRQVPNANLALQHNYAWGGAVVVALYCLGFRNSQITNNSSINNAKLNVNLFTKLIETMILMQKENLFKNYRGIIRLEVKGSCGKHHFWNISVCDDDVAIEDKDSNVKPNLILTVAYKDFKDVLKRLYAIVNVQNTSNSGLDLNKIHDSVLQLFITKSKI